MKEGREVENYCKGGNEKLEEWRGNKTLRIMGPKIAIDIKRESKDRWFIIMLLIKKNAGTGINKTKFVDPGPASIKRSRSLRNAFFRN